VILQFRTKATTMTFTGEQIQHPTSNGWSRKVMVAGVEYGCSISSGSGRWIGAVYYIGGAGLVWKGEVKNSIGCRGLLRRAGVTKGAK
jgi:hypothetical protein